MNNQGTHGNAGAPRRLRGKLLATVLLAAVLLAGVIVLPRLMAGRTPAVDAEREALLDEVQKAMVRYFWENADPRTGLVLDRSNNFRKSALTYAPSSIAAVGFGLPALVVAAERGFLPRAEVEARVLVTMRALRDIAEHERGFFYHFIDPISGRRAWHSEASSIDAALAVAGGLVAGSYFGGEIETIATEIYDRIDWAWMLDGGVVPSMGWKPEIGFLPHRWTHYDEASILYVLAIGSRTHPIPASSWFEVRRDIGEYKGHVSVISGPLFTHQYSHLFIDFRGITDGIADYWASSVGATLAHRQFAIDHAATHKGYGPNSWGFTASDGPRGYKAYSGPPGRIIHDGTIAPTAALGSFQFTPELSFEAMKHMRAIPGLWGLYGFADAYNLDLNWIATDAIGIDQGAIVMSIENARSGLFWRLFSERPEIQRAMSLIGFRPGTVEMRPTLATKIVARTLAERPKIEIPSTPAAPAIDGVKDAAWATAATIRIDSKVIESGSIDDDADVSAEIRILWDAQALYLLAEVADNEVITRQREKEIYRDDLLEIFVNPRNRGLVWGSPDDFQIGLSPDGDGAAWAWFQHLDPRTRGLRMKATRHGRGYVIEASIPWRFLEIRPRAGLAFGFSPAINDIDTIGSPEAKMNWFFFKPGIHIGEAVLKR